jgi:hypothetical protein
VLGFIYSSVDVHFTLKSQIDDAQRRLRDLIATVKEACAGEHFLVRADDSEPAKHTLVIEMLLAFKNPDGQHQSSVEVSECVCNLPNLSKESLQFMGDPNSPLHSPPGPYRPIAAGSSTDAVVRAVFSLPTADKVPSREVSGILSLIDNRGTQIDLPFNTKVIYNEPVRL